MRDDPADDRFLTFNMHSPPIKTTLIGRHLHHLFRTNESLDRLKTDLLRKKATVVSRYRHLVTLMSPTALIRRNTGMIEHHQDD